jgi:hypothetical protein
MSAISKNSFYLSRLQTFCLITIALKTCGKIQGRLRPGIVSAYEKPYAATGASGALVFSE